MAGGAAWGAGVSAPRGGGREPSGRGGSASRRRSLALLLAFACGASASGAILGLLKQPDPGDRADQFAFTTAAAVELARVAEDRARSARTELRAAKSRLAALSTVGAEEALSDSQEAERIAGPRYLRGLSSMCGVAGRRVMAALVRESRRNGLDPPLMAAVILVES